MDKRKGHEDYIWNGVTYDIDTGQLLHCLSASAEKEAAYRFSSTLCASTSTKKILPWDSVVALILYCVADLFMLSQNPWIIHVLVLEISDDLEALIFVSVSYKPSGAR